MKRISRRQLLAGATALGSLAAVRALAKSLPGATTRAKSGPDTLVLVELKGGNDGLNTVAPVRDPLYRRARPELALAEKDALGFAPGLWLHPAFAPLASAMQAGELAAVMNVGYARPNRSHFRSIEIWDQACGSDEILDDGWCTRALHAGGFDATQLAGVLLDSDSGPLAGARTLGYDDDDELARLATRAALPVPTGLTPAAQRIVALRADVQAEAARLSERIARVQLPADAFVASEKQNKRRVQQFATAARLVLADARVPVVKLTMPGFDTHRDQQKTQAGLLGGLAEGLASLRAVLTAAGAWSRVVVVVTSEFGRRVKENGNGGTDHGAACPVLVLGAGVRGGAHGTALRLDDLLDGDLRATTDHKDVFAAIARRVLGDAAADALAPTQRLALFA